MTSPRYWSASGRHLVGQQGSRTKSSSRVRVAPRQYCQSQEVTGEDGYAGDSSGSSTGSPVRGNELDPSSHSRRQQEEADEARGQSERSRHAWTPPDAAPQDRPHTGSSPASLCSQPKRGALRRQTRIQEDQLPDPWVPLSEPPQVQMEVTPPDETLSKLVSMDEDSKTAASHTSNPPPSPSPQNHTTPESKKGPPVAPKPAWFRQSLRKIPDKQDQKDQRPSVGFGTSFSASPRSASSAASLSIKQKIHSFETFANPGDPEKGGNRKVVTPSTSLPLVNKEPKEPRSQPAAPADSETTNKLSNQNQNCDSRPPPVTTPSCDAESPSSSDLISTDPEEAEDFQLVPVSDSTNVSHGNMELDKPDLSGTAQSNLTHPDLSSKSCSPAGMPTDGTEEDRHLSPPQSPSLEDEQMEKVLAFSNQVSQALMRTLPMAPCSQSQSHPPSSDLQGLSTADADRGFSVSLAKLTECSHNQGHEGSHIHSVISAIPAQEIQRLVPEALDGESLKQQLMDIHVVILHKEEEVGLGFSIAGGSDLENKAPTVHRVFPGGLADQEGTIHKGDEVLSINGQTLRGVPHAEATAALRHARALTLAVVVIRKRAGHDGRQEPRSSEVDPQMEQQGAAVSVQLEKGAGGVGFLLEGGKGSIHGDRPLVISRIFNGGAAEQSGLQCGDKVLQVQGISLLDMSRFEAWNIIKGLPEGSVTIEIRRKQADSGSLEKS